MKVIFMGTPDFAVNTLEKIIEGTREYHAVSTGKGMCGFPWTGSIPAGKNPGRCKCGIFEKVCARYHHSGGFRADSSKEYSRSSEIRMH